MGERISLWTGANLLCLARLLCAPIVAGLVFVADSAVHASRPEAHFWLWAAGGVFALAAATDAFDGWLARRSKTVSAFGAALDHAADKVLVAAALIALCVAFLPMDLVAAAMIIILRDLAVAGLREGVALAGRRIPVSRLGKLKTVAEMAGICLAIAGLALASANMGAPLLTAVEISARASLWSAAALAVITLGVYVQLAYAGRGDS